MVVWKSRDRLAGMAGLLLATLLGISDHGLWTPDEPRDAEISREMLLRGFPATPTLNQTPFLEKPPLYFWSVAGAFKLFGVSAGVSRLPSLLMGWATLFFTYLLALRMFGERAAFRSCLLLATTALFFHVTHQCLVDNALIAFTTASGYFLYEGFARPDRKLPWFMAAYGCALGAFLSKGLIGIALLGTGFLTFLFWVRKPREILRMQPWWGALLLVLGAEAWTYWLDPQDRQAFWITNHLGRFTGLEWQGGHDRPVYYYCYAWVYSFAPWSLLLPAVLPWALSCRETHRIPTRFLLSGVGAGFIVLSVAATKRELYLLPLTPAVAILAAAWLEEEAARSAWGWAIATTLAGLLVLAHLAVWGSAFYFRSYSGLAFAVGITAAGAMLIADRSRPALLASGALSLAAGAVLILVPALDASKSLAPFCRQLPSVDPFPAFKPDETTLSMIPFYTGHRVRPIDSVQEAESAATTKPAFIVVVLKRHSPRAGEDLAAAYPHLWLDQTLGGDRRLMLRSNVPR
jgi:4-amino-4-deoxy-L-arabinose transferase-like glycosyltransferase